MIIPLLRRLNSTLNNGFFKQRLQSVIIIANSNMHESNRYEQRNLLQYSNSLTIQSFLPVRTYGSEIIKTVTFVEMKSLKLNDTLIIDVRKPSELNESGTLPGCINIPLKELENALNSMGDGEFQKRYGRPKPHLDMPLIFSCRSGVRSTTASETAHKLGYTNIGNYKGGWLEWEKKNKQ